MEVTGQLHVPYLLIPVKFNPMSDMNRLEIIKVLGWSGGLTVGVLIVVSKRPGFDPNN
jgi:hypothetical protein